MAVTAELNGGARLEATTVTVSVGAAGDSAVSGTDYEAVSDFTLTIPAGAGRGQASFTLTPTDDGIAEGGEAITVAGAAGGLDVESATLTLEDDGRPSPELRRHRKRVVADPDSGRYRTFLTDRVAETNSLIQH